MLRARIQCGKLVKIWIVTYIHVALHAHAHMHKHTQLSLQKMFEVFIVLLPYKHIEAYLYSYVNCFKSYYFIFNANFLKP